MWLRNYDNMLCSMLGAGSSGSYPASTFGDGSLGIKNYLGNIIGTQNYKITEYNNYFMANMCTALTCMSENFTPTINISSSSAYPVTFIAVGSGTTPATYDDYTLESIYSSTKLVHIGYTASTIGFNEETKTWGKRITRKMRNNTSSPITISEIGIYGMIGYGVNKTSNALIYREVLDEPITVEADQKFEVSVDMYCQMIHHPDLA